jgi:biopolymer transport protein ExbD
MAELNTSNGAANKKARAKKALPKVDLTAMVDLAFLLITFFMLTTTLSKPTAMDIAKPDVSDPLVRMDVRDSQTMTILLGKDNKLAWYMGQPGKTAPEVQNYSQIRKTLLDNKNKVQQSTGRDIVLIIKPTASANYKNLVDIMDELLITGIKTAPAIDDVNILDNEKDFMSKQGIL